MPKQPMHRTSHQEVAGVAVGDLIRPARPAMIATGLLTALGALLSIVPFEAMRNLAAIWLGETSPSIRPNPPTTPGSPAAPDAPASPSASSSGRRARP